MRVIIDIEIDDLDLDLDRARVQALEILNMNLPPGQSHTLPVFDVGTVRAWHQRRTNVED